MARHPAIEWRGTGRIGAAIAVAAVHALFGYAFIAGLRVTLPAMSADDPLSLVVVDLKFPPPRPPEPPPKPRAEKPRAPTDQGGAAPPPKMRPIPQAAPAITTLPAPPRPIIVAPTIIGGNPAGGGTGGVGTGRGSIGSGSAQGESAGDGRGFSAARQIRGRFRNSDFPASAKGAGRLKIGVRYAVGPSGSVDQCEIIDPSGYPEVDAMTCRVIVARYRFKPARDAQGVPITEVMEEDYTWTMD